MTVTRTVQETAGRRGSRKVCSRPVWVVDCEPRVTMRLRALLRSDSRAASEVIGVILMVAITAIIASVIGAFMLGIGDRTSDSVPQAAFSYDFDDQTNVTITHDGTSKAVRA